MMKSVNILRVLFDKLKIDHVLFFLLLRLKHDWLFKAAQTALEYTTQYVAA